MMGFFGALFSRYGFYLLLYFIIGVFVNTAAPHIPPSIHAFGGDFTLIAHSWIQYFLSVFTWPLSFWQPPFTLGKWTGV